MGADSSSQTMRIGFMPLTDAAVVIAAADAGFGAAYGLDIVLSRENSWASLRDKLVVGMLDAAHILAPLAMTTHLGLGHLRKALAVPLRLNLDGGVIAVSLRFGEGLAECGFDGHPLAFPAALGAAAIAHRERSGTPLTFATVFPASSHQALMRRLALSAGIEEGRDVRFVVLAPPRMVDALAAGVIDGFCAGAPWGTVAVDLGVGRIVATGADFGAGRTEKVLALTADTVAVRPGMTTGLVAALCDAADWCAAPAHWPDLAAMLAAPDRLDIPAALILRSLEGAMVRRRGGLPEVTPQFLTLGPRAIARPGDVDVAAVLGETGEDVSGIDARLAGGLFRQDIFDRAQALHKK